MTSLPSIIDLKHECFRLFRKQENLSHDVLDYISAILCMDRLPTSLYVENREAYYSLLRTEIIHAIYGTNPHVLGALSAFLKTEP
jgi:hypothetical protein